MKPIALMVVLLGLAVVPAAQGDTQIPAGFDLFETDPEQTVFRFQDQTAIPENFFAPGSEKFEGTVNFGGEPIVRFEGQNVGDADTVIAHPAFVVPAGGQDSDTVDIELRVLSLGAMAPITVHVNGSAQKWDVEAKASASRPSTGQLRAAEPASGGIMDSQLTVYPTFTFTRLSDGATKVLDVGALPDGNRPEVVLTGIGTPWRAGCVFPALAVAGLNDGFCPAQNDAGEKVLSIEDGQLARHGIRPAQPRLEHFQCYSLADHSTFNSRAVKLSDQFGDRAGEAGQPTRFCNPVKKAKEAVDNERDHLYCYRTTGPDVDKRVRLRNQFGPFTGRVHKPTSLCLPTRKRLPGKKAPPKSRFQIDHFQCYALKAGKAPARSVPLDDQFGKNKMKIGKPSILCAPVSKDGGGIDHPVRHLVCYVRTNKPPPVIRKLTAINQFGKKQRARTKRPVELCVPSNKLVG